MPRTAALLLAVSSLACANAPSASAPEKQPSPAKPAAPAAAPEEPVKKDAAAEGSYLDLATLQVRSFAEGAPGGLYIRGAVQDGAFVPSSDVEGEGALGARGSPGYLELSTMSFMPAQEARQPAAPYVEGAMTEQGFVPSSRKIVRFAR